MASSLRSAGWADGDPGAVIQDRLSCRREPMISCPNFSDNSRHVQLSDNIGQLPELGHGRSNPDLHGSFSVSFLCLGRGPLGMG